MTTSVAT